MVGITLSAEQIRTAPPEVRRWLEQQLALSLGLQLPESPSHPSRPHLVACSFEELSEVLSLIRGMLPVVNVFFELGREGGSLGAQGVEAFPLVDILRHTRLHTLDQVVACLDTIDEAVRRVRGDASAAFYGLDSRGYCFVAEQTQHNIARLWKRTISERGFETAMAGADPSSGAASGELAPGLGYRSPSLQTASAATAPGQGDGMLSRPTPDAGPSGILPG